MIFAVIGLSSANRHVTARSLGSGARFRSIDATEDGGVSNCTGVTGTAFDHESDTEPSPVVDTDAVRSRLGIELRRDTSPSRWLSLNRSTAPNSDGLRAWLPALPGVGGPRETDEEMEDVDVAGDGGFVGSGGLEVSTGVTILVGFLIPTRLDILRRLEWILGGSERACVSGASC